MDLRGARRSRNIDDRRGRRGPARPSRIPLPRGRGRLSIGAVLLIVGVGWALGADPIRMLALLADGGAPSAHESRPREPAALPPEGDPVGDFLSRVLADTEDTWNALFQESGRRYDEPTLVLFDGAVDSACGFTSAAVGPFYCPADERLYLDTSFLRELDESYGAPGDFAQAYVIAHEVGHHVQKLLGIADRVSEARRRLPEAEANAMQVRMELQADCLAGVWAHHAERMRDRLEPGDVDEGLRAAAAIGDDRLQRRATGTVQPESWTHGSSAMRKRWLEIGLERGDPDACDTFRAEL